MAFVVLATAGIGIVAYGLLWLTMPQTDALPDDAPRRERTPRQYAVLGLIALVSFVLLQGLSSWGGNLALPLVLLAGGLAVIWRQLDADRGFALPSVRWALAAGVALAGAGVVLLLATTGQLGQARDGFAATLVILAGIVLATAPLWRRLLDSRDGGAAARIRSEERAAVAAHLHDSVLQTLALIQRHADDPARSAGWPAARSASCAPGCTAGGRPSRAARWPGWSPARLPRSRTTPASPSSWSCVGDAPLDDGLAALGARPARRWSTRRSTRARTAVDLYAEVDAGAR